MSRPDDPILIVIDKHRQAVADWREASAHAAGLEDTLPPEKRRSYIFAGEGVTVISGDDPAWITAIRRLYEAGRIADDIALALTRVRPASVAGVAALLLWRAVFIFRRAQLR
jgi:hypothetical protein